MSSLDSVQRGKGPTIIGSSNNQKSVLSSPTKTQRNSVSTVIPAQPSIQSREIPQEEKKEFTPPLVSVSKEQKKAEQSIAQEYLANTPIESETLAIPPRPASHQEVPKVISTTAPTYETLPVYDNFAADTVEEEMPPVVESPVLPEQTSNQSEEVSYPSTQELAETSALSTAGDTARTAFLASNTPLSASVHNIDIPPEVNTLYKKDDSTIQFQPFGAQQVAQDTSVTYKKPKKVSRVPLYFSFVALVISLIAVGLTATLGKPSGAQASQSTSSNTSDITITSALKATTYLAKNSLDPEKKVQTEFKKGDPIQACIEYSALPASTLIQVRILKEVDGGSQLEVIATRINASGTDSRCLPFTGAQAAAGNYTIELTKAKDAISDFVKAFDTKFIISEGAATSSSQSVGTTEKNSATKNSTSTL